MKTTRTIIGVITILSLAGFEALNAKVAAKFESLSGLVQYREKNGKWQNAKIGSPLTANTELQTGPNGKATLLFPNGTKVTLNSGTLASLDQYTAGAYGTQTNMSLRVGRMNADIAKVNDANARNHFRVRTPTVVAGVRGSNADITNGSSTTIRMNEHSMEMRDGNGQQSTVPQGGQSQISKNETITSDKMQSKENTVVITGGEGATAGEAEMSMTAGDFTFSGNLSDIQDLFDLFDLFEAYQFGFGNQVTFEKL